MIQNTTNAWTLGLHLEQVKDRHFDNGHVYTHTHILSNTHTHPYTLIHCIHTHTHPFTCIHTHTHLYTPIHTHSHTYKLIHTHTHPYTPIHMHKCMQTYTPWHTHPNTSAMAFCYCEISLLLPSMLCQRTVRCNVRFLKRNQASFGSGKHEYRASFIAFFPGCCYENSLCLMADTMAVWLCFAVVAQQRSSRLIHSFVPAVQ